MHYFIDGYNMLFRLMHAEDNLQIQRKRIIYDLNKKISLVKFDVSVVFDANFQEGEGSRSHFNELEILFTAEGETADEFILDELKNSLHPQQETIVTSDKILAWHARRYSAHTESVESFFLRLNKIYKNKQKQIKKPSSTKVISKTPLTTEKVKQAPSLLIPDSKATNEECMLYYEQVFEAEFQEIIQKEHSQKNKSSTSNHQNKKFLKKKKLFSNNPPVKDAPTEMERWLKAFEDKMNHSDPYSSF